jgi:hypothetical protein
LNALLAVAGIEDEPTFTRSTMVNTQEEVQTIVQAASYLEDEYVTRKIMTILGDTDLVEETLKKIEAEKKERLDAFQNEEETDEETEEE